jgi:hypothetical protein
VSNHRCGRIRLVIPLIIVTVGGSTEAARECPDRLSRPAYCSALMPIKRNDDGRLAP